MHIDLYQYPIAEVLINGQSWRRQADVDENTSSETAPHTCLSWMGYECISWVSCWTWWRHKTKIFSALLALCAGNSPVTVNYPHKGQWRGALMFSLICAWINRWVNNREAGDFRRHHPHHDVIVMKRRCVIQHVCHAKDISKMIRVIIPWQTRPICSCNVL